MTLQSAYSDMALKAILEDDEKIAADYRKAANENLAAYKKF